MAVDGQGPGALGDKVALRRMRRLLRPRGRPLLSLRLRRTWRKLTKKGSFWADPFTGESAGEWLRKKQAAARQSDE